jgi:hypothetical protein
MHPKFYKFLTNLLLYLYINDECLYVATGLKNDFVSAAAIKGGPNVLTTNVYKDGQGELVAVEGQLKNVLSSKARIVLIFGKPGEAASIMQCMYDAKMLGKNSGYLVIGADANMGDGGFLKSFDTKKYTQAQIDEMTEVKHRMILYYIDVSRVALCNEVIEIK